MFFSRQISGCLKFAFKHDIEVGGFLALFVDLIIETKVLALSVRVQILELLPIELLQALYLLEKAKFLIHNPLLDTFQASFEAFAV